MAYQVRIDFCGNAKNTRYLYNELLYGSSFLRRPSTVARFMGSNCQYSRRRSADTSWMLCGGLLLYSYVTFCKKMARPFALEV